jgi:HEAT repeat protein/cyclophilin family peptidyl-prolyl cis-trans isomerase
MRTVRSAALWLLLGSALTASVSSAPARKPLTPADIDDIAQLVMLEDTRRFDQDTLSRLIKSSHPEVRRRAVVSVGRIVKTGVPPDASRLLLATARTDADPEIVATVAWASGQLKDPGAVAWLAELLSSALTPAGVAKEAAGALGKIRSPEARAGLAKFLTEAPATAKSSLAVGEALLAFGRFPLPGDVTPILRWTSSADGEIRWRAAWALFRPRDPAAVPHLLKMSEDKSGEVRSWAVRGLTAALADAAKIDRATTSARLRDATHDPDRRVRTEALRSLGGYDDDASFAVMLAALDSPDSWISVTAAESMARFKDRAAAIVPRLVAAEAATRPTALRITALAPLVALGPEAAIEPAAALMREPSGAAKSAANQALGRRGGPGRAKLDALAADPATRDQLPPPPAPRTPRPAEPARTLAEYRAIVERWIVTAYNGARPPRTIWTTPKGEIDIELYPGDAPLGLEHLVRVVESGSIVGTEFTRVVADFVDQQATIRDASLLRDEVNRHGLTRANLSWASAGLDTGRPGYTLGSTPQPHNEGDFTALGRVIKGMDVVDRIELGDKITAARMIK